MEESVINVRLIDMANLVAGGILEMEKEQNKITNRNSLSDLSFRSYIPEFTSVMMNGHITR